MGDLTTTNTKYTTLIENIGTLLNSARCQAAATVNTLLVQTYWHIGEYIVEYEQGGSNRAQYGAELLKQLSRDLTLRYGKGFNRNNLQYMRKLYLTFPNCTTLSCKLTWSHYFEILKADDVLEISFYTKECEKERWTVRELKRQMKSMLFHRLALSTDKAGVLALAEKGVEIASPKDIIRDPVVLDFLQLPVHAKEKRIERSIIDHLQMFLLEMGKGFAFVARQQHIMLGGRHFYIDLVFYHCILKTYVLIDLKSGMVRHEDIGQMNLYINYYKSEVCTEGDTEPIGIVLGAYKDDLTIEYALQGISNQLFVSKYQLYLPDKDLLRKQLLEAMDNKAK